jgi:hypothetical protein
VGAGGLLAQAETSATTIAMSGTIDLLMLVIALPPRTFVQIGIAWTSS